MPGQNPYTLRKNLTFTPLALINIKIFLKVHGYLAQRKVKYMPGVFGKGLTYSRQIVIAQGKIFAVSGQAGKPKSLQPARIFLVLAWGLGVFAVPSAATQRHILFALHGSA